MKIKIFQVDYDLDEHGIMFMDYEYSKKYYNTLNELIEIYKCEYEYEEQFENENYNIVLDKVFQKFNMERPDDFSGRSLSVSDIVFLDDTPYFCDSFGWIELR